MDQILPFIMQHWMLSTAFVVMLIAFIANELLQKNLGLPSVTAEQAVHLMNHQEAVVIDVRNEASYKEGHILGSTNIPSNAIEKKLNLLQKHAEKPIIVVCALGNEANRVGSILKQKQFKVFVLQGGVSGWKEANMPLVKK